MSFDDMQVCSYYLRLRHMITSNTNTVVLYRYFDHDQLIMATCSIYKTCKACDTYCKYKIQLEKRKIQWCSCKTSCEVKKY